MTRQSISFTTPNNDWLISQVESEEYNSKSDVVNNLVRKARETELIRAQLLKSEKSGFTDMSREEILSKSKKQLRGDGKL